MRNYKHTNPEQQLAVSNLLYGNSSVKKKSKAECTETEEKYFEKLKTEEVKITVEDTELNVYIAH